MDAVTFVDLADQPYCYLRTTGRRSGRPHTIEIWFAAVDARLYLISGGGDRSDWVRNLQADASACVRIGDQELPVGARAPSRTRWSGRVPLPCCTPSTAAR
jgi:deazaflavin-dependent oxidoreductase (nitroreductase family)